MSLVVLYVRRSTDKQENSIENQIEALTAYAKTHNMQIAEIYADKGISGRTASKRKEFMRPISDSASEAFSTVLIYDSSRFARNPEESLVYKSELKKNGVQLISITDEDWDMNSLGIGEAIVGLPFAKPFRFQFDLYEGGFGYAVINVERV